MPRRGLGSDSAPGGLCTLLDAMLPTPLLCLPSLAQTLSDPDQRMTYDALAGFSAESVRGEMKCIDWQCQVLSHRRCGGHAI